MAKLQVIVRMVSKEMADPRVEIQNEFPLEEARRRYRKLIAKVVPLVEPMLASATVDASDKPSCPSCGESVFRFWWPAIGEAESEKVACGGCGKLLVVTMVSDMKFSVREGGAE